MLLSYMAKLRSLRPLSPPAKLSAPERADTLDADSTERKYLEIIAKTKNLPLSRLDTNGDVYKGYRPPAPKGWYNRWLEETGQFAKLAERRANIKQNRVKKSQSPVDKREWNR